MLGTNDQKRRAIISILEKGTKREHGRNRVSEVVQLQFAHSHLPFERFETKGLSVSRKSFSSVQRIFRIHGFHERPTHARSRFEVTSRGTSGREGVKLPLNQERVFTYKYPRAI